MQKVAITHPNAKRNQIRLVQSDGINAIPKNIQISSRCTENVNIYIPTPDPPASLLLLSSTLPAPLVWIQNSVPSSKAAMVLQILRRNDPYSWHRRTTSELQLGL